jgi:hypothetical protein
VGKPGVQKTLLICLINIHNFRNSDCFLVDRSSKNLTTLYLFIKYFGRSCLRSSHQTHLFVPFSYFRGLRHHAEMYFWSHYKKKGGWLSRHTISSAPFLQPKQCLNPKMFLISKKKIRGVTSTRLDFPLDPMIFVISHPFWNICHVTSRKPRLPQCIMGDDLHINKQTNIFIANHRRLTQCRRENPLFSVCRALWRPTATASP